MNPNSYEKNIDPASLSPFIQWVEQGFSKPFNRLLHFEGLFCDNNALLLEKMYPFAYLRASTKTQIQRLAAQAVKLAECHTLLYDDDQLIQGEEPEA